EGTAAEELKAPLEAMGHKINIRKLTSGLHAVQIIRVESVLEAGETAAQIFGMPYTVRTVKKELRGAADPRREGVALGL
ncbi:MAG: hypothetical protein ACR2P5_07960, partial [Gammaproteobacteria bacterium]